MSESICTPFTAARSSRTTPRSPEYGVKLELETWHTGSIWNIRYLIEQGLLDPPYFTSIFFGWPGGSWTPATVEEYLARRAALPEESVATVSIMDPEQMRILAAAITHGDHVRVGTEDHPYDRPAVAPRPTSWWPRSPRLRARWAGGLQLRTRRAKSSGSGVRSNERPLTARVALVTGAAQGIGNAAADRLRGDGYSVVGGDIHGLCWGGTPDWGAWWMLDVADEEQVAALFGPSRRAAASMSWSTSRGSSSSSRWSNRAGTSSRARSA